MLFHIFSVSRCMPVYLCLIIKRKKVTIGLINLKFNRISFCFLFQGGELIFIFFFNTYCKEKFPVFKTLINEFFKCIHHKKLLLIILMHDILYPKTTNMNNNIFLFYFFIHIF